MNKMNKFLKKKVIQASLKLLIVIIFLISIISIVHSDQQNSQKYTEETWQPLIKKYAEKYNVPPELVSIQMKAESGFKPDAISRVGAAGLIQLMPCTAKGLGLKVYKPEICNVKDPPMGEYKRELEELKNSMPLDQLMLMDERFNPEKNIETGVKYLSSQIKLFNDIKFGLAAYNSGEGNVNAACCIEPSGRKNYNCLKKKYYPYDVCFIKLPKETQGYVPRIYDAYEKKKGVSVSWTDKAVDFFKPPGADKVMAPVVNFGTYSVVPNFKVELAYDYNVIQEKINSDVKEFSKCKVAQGADEKLNCLQSQIAQRSDEILTYSLDCSMGTENIMYKFLDDYHDCIYSTIENCTCPMLFENPTDYVIKSEYEDGEYKVYVEGSASNFATLDIGNNVFPEKIIISKPEYYDSSEYDTKPRDVKVFFNSKIDYGEASKNEAYAKYSVDGKATKDSYFLLYKKSKTEFKFGFENTDGSVDLVDENLIQKPSQCNSAKKIYRMCAISKQKLYQKVESRREPTLLNPSTVETRVEERPIQYNFAIDLGDKSESRSALGQASFTLKDS